MRKNLFLRKIQQNKAFTLLEMLVVVAMVVILLVISSLALVNWVKTFKMTELDNYAKTIYLEAQNQLSAKEVEGGLLAFYGDVLDESIPFLNAAPKDYAVGDMSWDQLCYVTNLDGGTAILEELIPSGSAINDLNGYYLIEFNPQTGDIYAVFYWEKENTAISSYASIQTVERDKDTRSEVELGYYGGADVIHQETLSSPFELDQRVEVINSEELYVKISFKNSDILKNYYQTGLSIECTVYDEEGESGYVWTKEVDLSTGKNVVENGDRLEVYVLLDGVQNSFSHITADDYGNCLTPGDDVRISIHSEFRQGAYSSVQDSGIIAGYNSLFAKKEVNGDTTTIYVTKLRHLRNLDASFYDASAGTKNYEIVLANDIDMNAALNVWSGDTYMGSAGATGITGMTPIVNEDIFQNTIGTTTVEGKNNEIRNLVIVASGNNAGLFSMVQNVAFANIQLIDMVVKASGYNNVGALVGQLSGGTVDNCGVYLSTYVDSGMGKKYYSEMESSSYGNKMLERCNTICINGATNVGGLIGKATNGTIFTKVYAAEKVNGTSNVGGLIGYAEDVRIENSYASGDVVGTIQNVGGFLGYATQTTVTDAYSSSDVYGADIVGGLLGYTDNSTYQNCFAYGEVLTLAGNADFDVNNDGVLNRADGDVRAGGLLSVSGCGENVESLENTCFYMTQSLYNNHGEFDGFTELGKGYGNLKIEGGLSANVSHPYDANLLYKAFPFQAVVDHHYGDWTLQYLVNTSLVYYERYEGDVYGYYCVTTLTSDDGSVADGYVWVLDTLRDTECLEDGYALLSRYYLESFDYELQIGSDGSVDLDETITIGSESVENTAVLLRQQGFLEFKAYTPISSSTESDYSADYSEEDVKDIFSLSGMYLYQLPYELQSADRSGVDNFYDKFIVYNGVEKTEGEGSGEPVIGGTTATEGVSFFYCPHFAKTAVNPGTSGASADTLKNPANVYVRSARQLNALGRFSYYWNNKKGLTTEITYVQEVDINFRTYTTSYCGEYINFLAFDQPYSNAPIGQWNGDSTGLGAFTNNYDGGYNKIIDYCVKSNNQYVGLFGEIYKAEGATGAQIQNIVMVVSNEHDEEDERSGNYLTVTDPKKQNNAGLIIGSFIDTSGKSGANRPRTGVGAMVGSDYTIGITDGDASVFTILNCATSGYTVEYHIENPVGGQQPLGIAVGGMVGYSRGNIAQCSAVNDVQLVVRANMVGDEAAVCVGGFAGSYYYGTMLNCYSGGTIDVDDNSGVYCVNRMRIGGLCPGWLDAPGIKNTWSSEKVRYQNVYAYTEPTERVWAVKESASAGVFNHFFPTVSRMRLVYETRTVSIFFRETKWHTDSTNGDTTGVRVPGFSYYVSSIITDTVMNRISSEAKEYFQDNTTIFDKKPKTCDPATYEQLSNLTWVNSNTNSGATVQFIATDLYSMLMKASISVPYVDSLEGQSYPFPAFVRDENGNFVHYGDWPTE